MATFGQLKKAVIKHAEVKDLFDFRNISPAHNSYWDRMNAAEYSEGYDQGSYSDPNSPTLCDMELLSQNEYQNWYDEFIAIHNKFKKTQTT